MPDTSGARRPIRSEIAPIGTETTSSVTPNEANSRPMTVGEAPSRSVRSGRTGTAIEYATRSVNAPSVTKKTARRREERTAQG